MKQAFVHKMRRAVALLGFAAAAAACSDGGSSSVTDVSGNTTNPNAASIAAYAGDGQSATVGTAVPNYPIVIVADAQGQALAGVTVKFTVTQGGGQIQHASVVTDARGMASGGNWTLGSVTGANALVATAGSLAPVYFTATALAPAPAPSTSYNIVVRYVVPASARQQQAVTAAVARWQSVVSRDLPDIPLQAPVNSCWTGQPALNERVDDILIYVDFSDIDGAGKVLGQAGPCYVRSDSNLPILGQLKLDNADLVMMEQTGTLDDVVLHEIGHILGIGTLWPDKNLLQGAGTTDPRFIGPNAIAAYQGLGGIDPTIAVENTGADGTKDGHWRESTFGNELMTGYIGGRSNPMSSMTIASLTDLGYGTNASAASSYTLTNRTSGVVAGFDIQAHERMERPKYKVDRAGRKTKIAR